MRVEIQLFGAGPKARLYAIRLPEQAKPEVARFFDRIRDGTSGTKHKQILAAASVILDWLNRIATLEGAQERFFRPREGRGLALPLDAGPLRLYCYRLDDKTLVLCGGGVKEAQTVQDSPDCLPHFNLMNSVISELKRRRITSAQLLASAGSSFPLAIIPPTDYDSAR